MLSLEYLVWDSVTLEEYGSCRQESKINRRCFISLFLLSASLPMRRKKKHCWPGEALQRPYGAPAGPRAAGLTSSHSPAAGAPQAAAARSAPAPLAREQPEVPEAVLRFGAKIQERGCADRTWGGGKCGLDHFRIPSALAGTLPLLRTASCQPKSPGCHTNPYLTPLKSPSQLPRTPFGYPRI